MKKLKLEELNRIDIKTFKEIEKTPLIFIMDNVRSANNIGSAFRTSDAFACEELIMCGIAAQPPHRDIHKTALGATESVDWRYFEDTHEAVKDLQNKGYKVFAVEQVENPIMLQDLEVNSESKCAFVMGNEVDGVQQSVIEVCDGVVELPQFGTKHSFNVSVTLGIVGWEFVRKYKLV